MGFVGEQVYCNELKTYQTEKVLHALSGPTTLRIDPAKPMHFAEDNSYANIGGRRVQIGAVENLVRQSADTVIEVTFVKSVKVTPCSRAEALEWFAEQLRLQIPPPFQADIAVTVQGKQP